MKFVGSPQCQTPLFFHGSQLAYSSCTSSQTGQTARNAMPIPQVDAQKVKWQPQAERANNGAA